jgi:hypothetical protein
MGHQSFALREMYSNPIGAPRNRLKNHELGGKSEFGTSEKGVRPGQLEGRDVGMPFTKANLILFPDIGEEGFFRMLGFTF